MKRFILSILVLAGLSSPLSASDSVYQEAAKLEMAYLASDILAASLCKGVEFNGDAVIPHLAAAAILLGRDRAQDSFLAAIRKNVDQMSAEGRDAWCTATVQAARDRDSEMLTEGDQSTREK